MRIFKWLAAGAGIGVAAYGAYVATTWWRYGRARPADGAARDDLLDRFMSHYDVHERHAIDVAAPADVTLSAAKDFDLESSRIVRAIFRGRELLLRSSSDGEHIQRTIRVGANVTPEQRARLAEIAEKTPVTLTLKRGTPIVTTFE